MKISETQSAHVTNAEVLGHLNDIATRRRARAPQQSGRPVLKSPNFETVIKELTSYLAPSSPSPVPSYHTHYSSESIRRVMVRLEKFKFTKPELMMILNLRPGKPVYLDAIIEECDSRLTGQEQMEVLEIIGEILGSGDGENEDVSMA